MRKIYLSVSQEENGLYGHYECYQAGDKTLDSDLLEDYTVYEHETTGTYIAEHKPTNYAFGSYATLGEALDAVRDFINERNEIAEKIKQKSKEWDGIVNRNSLDERYKDKVVVKKRLSNEELRKKYSKIEKVSRAFNMRGARIEARSANPSRETHK